MSESSTPENRQAPEPVTIPSWFSVVAVLALIWNSLGIMAFIAHMMMTPEKLAELPQAEQNLHTAIPVWALVAFAFAVFAGALASLALVMKKMICYRLFIVSFIGVIVQMFHSFFIGNSFDVYGPSGMIMPIMVIVIAFVLVRFSAKGINNNWFN
jgi:hypothetical protein